MSVLVYWHVCVLLLAVFSICAGKIEGDKECSWVGQVRVCPFKSDRLRCFAKHMGAAATLRSCICYVITLRVRMHVVA